MSVNAWSDNTEKKPVEYEEKKPLDDEKPQGAKEALKEFLEGTTFHGARYTIGSPNKVRRCIWLICILTMTVGLTIFVTSALIKYKSYPTTTTTTVRYANQMEFPAVTICNVNMFKNTYLQNESFSDLSAALRSLSGLRFRPKEFNFSDPEAVKKLGKYNVKEFIEAAKHPLNNLFRYCEWQGVYVACEDIFEPSTMIDSFCYTFNSHKAVLERGGPLNNTRRGERGGLNVQMDAEVWDYSNTIGSIVGSGVKVVIHEPNEYPNVDRSFVLSPGTMTKAVVSMKKNIGLPPPFEDSWCDDITKPELEELYHKYTWSACLAHCYNQMMVKDCGCRPIASLGNETICSAGTYALCGVHTIHKYLTDSNIGKTCECHRPCEETVYTKSLSNLKYPSPILKAEYAYIFPYFPFDVFGNNGLQMYVFFEDFSWTETVQRQAYTLIDFAADLGGQMGLFLGASILTFVELIEFLCYVVTLPLKAKNNKATTKVVQIDTTNNKY